MIFILNTLIIIIACNVSYHYLRLAENDTQCICFNKNNLYVRKPSFRVHTNNNNELYIRSWLFLLASVHILGRNRATCMNFAIE